MSCRLDARVLTHYLAPMTRRMLLTLIAILTGLSWQGSAVHARALPAAAQVSMLATAQQAKVSAVAARPISVSTGPVVEALPEQFATQIAAPAPRVRTRIDRARE